MGKYWRFYVPQHEHTQLPAPAEATQRWGLAVGSRDGETLQNRKSFPWRADAVVGVLMEAEDESPLLVTTVTFTHIEINCKVSFSRT